MTIRPDNSGVSSATQNSLRARTLFTATLIFASIVSIYDSRALSAKAPLQLENSIPIPGVPIWPYVDHMAIDLAHHRLFTTPQRARSVAVINLRTDRVSQMIQGLGNPHEPFYDQTLNRLFVSNGTPGAVEVFDGNNYSLIKTIHLAPGADGLVYDNHNHLIYVANGMGNVNGDGTHTGRASIAVIDPLRMEVLADIPITTGGIEGMAVDSKFQTLYVSLPDLPGIGVVDLVKRRLAVTWSLPHGHEPFALAVYRGRLYVACRDTIHSTDVNGTLFVLNTTTGRRITKLPIGGWVDGISVNRKRHQIYMSSGMGYVDTYSIGARGTYRQEPRVKTALLAKTSIYSSKANRLYVAVPQVGDGPARIMVFKPAP